MKNLFSWTLFDFNRSKIFSDVESGTNKIKTIHMSQFSVVWKTALTEVLLVLGSNALQSSIYNFPNLKEFQEASLKN